MVGKMNDLNQIIQINGQKLDYERDSYIEVECESGEYLILCEIDWS